MDKDKRGEVKERGMLMEKEKQGAGARTTPKCNCDTQLHNANTQLHTILL